MKTYAAFSKNIHERLKSSSGGIFSLIAKEIIFRGGIVYGVLMTKDCKAVEYRRVVDVYELEKLRGSKYLQAKIGNTYEKVKKDLESNLNVLFTGTACQVNGLKKYLGKDYSTLFCVDIVCHGVPSPKLWEEYIESKHKRDIIDIQFRCKDLGWSNYGMKEITRKKSYFIPKEENPFMVMFLKDFCLRPSCYKCLAKENKLSDMSIGDFWGIDDVAPEMNDDKGISLIILRTDKGEQLFVDIQEKLLYKKVTYEEGIRCNPAENRSAAKPLERTYFFSDMNKMSFEELRKKYVIIPSPSIKKRIKKIAKNILGKI